MQIEKTIIYTDGSSKGNPGPGGWGAIVAYNDDKAKAGSLKLEGITQVVELGGREGHTTNNRMELTACIEALKFTSSSQLQAHSFLLYTDSEYVKKGITEWIFNWEKNGWRTSAKKPVMNADLWQELKKVSEGKDIEWKVVKGHADTPGNNRCDEIATSFADDIPTALYDGEEKNYQIKIRI